MTNTADWDAVPDIVRTFMTALEAREVDQALGTLSADAVVTDEGRDRFTLDGALIGRLVIEP